MMRCCCGIEKHVVVVVVRESTHIHCFPQKIDGYANRLHDDICCLVAVVERVHVLHSCFLFFQSMTIIERVVNSVQD
jgi:hypothetical protein